MRILMLECRARRHPLKVFAREIGLQPLEERLDPGVAAFVQRLHVPDEGIPKSLEVPLAASISGVV
ncbi:uncharacterized protein BKA78DRAFT_328926 [Phyllosticta capitalensis]|uniref:uncharacterized protein n=1 Tax=Phyllosticta capitalensis TaxID=121624 RepID=UPI00312FB286